MANEYTAEVVRYLRRKNSSGYDPITYLGAEQRFVSGLRNSNVNNLEEQYIAGTDTYTEEYEDSQGNQIIVKSFCKTGTSPADASNYYKLVTTKYASALANTDYFFDGATFVMPHDDTQVVFGDGTTAHPSLTTVYGENRNIFNITASGEMDIYPPSLSTLQEDKLYFVTTGSSEVLVLTKTTGVKFVTEGGISKRIIKESVVNNLTT